MKPLKPLMIYRNACPAAIMLALGLVTGAAQAHVRSQPMVAPEPMALEASQGKALTEAQVKQAILNGASQLDWSVVDDKPGKITLRHRKGSAKIEAVVDAVYDTNSIQLRYVSSEGLYYENKDGSAMVHPTYNVWIRNLRQRIDSAVALLRQN